MKFAKSFALIATVLLSSASVAVASDISVNADSNRDKLGNEAQGMCWPGQLRCTRI
jgi:hypothetical protein